VYQYSGLDKVTNILEGEKVISSYQYSINGQLASATADGATESFLWDGLALIRRGDTDYTNEPYVTGGNPVVAGDKILFNDILGNTVRIKSEDKLKLIQMTAFGETADKDAFFTGKPTVNNLGYSFLFRNYRADQGKWLSQDPRGYPDGWNNQAYALNRVTNSFDAYGLAYETHHDTVSFDVKVYESDWSDWYYYAPNTSVEYRDRDYRMDTYIYDVEIVLDVPWYNTLAQYLTVAGVAAAGTIVSGGPVGAAVGAAIGTALAQGMAGLGVTVISIKVSNQPSAIIQGATKKETQSRLKPE